MLEENAVYEVRYLRLWAYHSRFCASGAKEQKAGAKLTESWCQTTGATDAGLVSN